MIAERLSALRKQMALAQIDAYFIPSSDPHSSEYVAEYWQGRRWISGFTGTAGTVVVTQTSAGLWTDGRYYIQAEEQLADSGIQLFRAADVGVPSWSEWLAQTLSVGSCIGFDGAVVSVSQAQACLQAGFKLAYQQDLLNHIWLDRPALPQSPAFEHATHLAGLSVADKLAQVRRLMRQSHADYQLLTTLDDCAWLFNIRGSDIAYCPVVLCYALVSLEQCWLFMDSHKLPSSLAQALRAQGVVIQDYGQCATQLALLPDHVQIRLDLNLTNFSLFNQLPEKVKVQAEPQLTTALKAIKNPIEQQHFRDCMQADGVAMVRFMRWLDQEVPTGKVTELDAEAQLEALRQMIPGYQQPSFRTIAGFAAHGAKMHYAATEASNAVVQADDFFLVDSGGQFLNGTTDITRTFNYGALTEQQCLDYTLVLKAHIALARAKFKSGCRGAQIDALARAPLWEYGIDYGCGTGHGVGFFLNVHEGPQNLSQKWIDVPLEVGMTVTIEPGIYREGQYGIRIENTLLIVEDQTTEFGRFYRFEPLTLAPINTKPVMTELLSRTEIEWLNQYHHIVFERLSVSLNAEEIDWLALQTQAIA